MIRHLFIERNEAIIVDMEAGLEHLGRGSTAGMDAFIVVVEPGVRSIQTAYHIKKLAADIGINRIFVVGNKVNDEKDVEFLKENLKDFEFLGYVKFNMNIIKADRENRAPFEIDPTILDEVKVIYENLKKLI